LPIFPKVYRVEQLMVIHEVLASDLHITVSKVVVMAHKHQIQQTHFKAAFQHLTLCQQHSVTFVDLVHQRALVEIQALERLASGVWK